MQKNNYGFQKLVIEKRLLLCSLYFYFVIKVALLSQRKILECI